MRYVFFLFILYSVIFSQPDMERAKQTPTIYLLIGRNIFNKKLTNQGIKMNISIPEAI